VLPEHAHLSITWPQETGHMNKPVRLLIDKIMDFTPTTLRLTATNRRLALTRPITGAEMTIAQQLASSRHISVKEMFSILRPVILARS